MSLRQQLLILILVLAVLPVSGWFTAKELQAALRTAEARAAIAAAQPLARAMAAAMPVQVGAGSTVLHAFSAAHPRTIDGFDDDWRPWLRFGQRFESRETELGFDLHLTVHGRRLQGLIVVSDRTANARGRPADEIQMVGGSGWAFRITEDIAGNAHVERLDEPTGDTPLKARWQSVTGVGYRVEFDLPRSLPGDSLDITVLDYGDGLPGTRPIVASTGTASRPAQLRFPDTGLRAALAALASDDARIWLVDTDRWVLGVAGGPVVTRNEAQGGWRRAVFRWLEDDQSMASRAPEPGMDLQLGDAEVASALAGRPTSRLVVEPSGVRSLTAVPVRRGDRTVGALLVETPGDALLLTSNRAFAGTVLAASAVVAFVMFGLFAYIAWLSFRIRRLRDAAEAYAAGSAESLPRLTARDEVGDLARSFERLVEQLDDYNHYLQGLAGRLAHELDTPLSIVRSSLDNLQSQPLAPEAAAYADRAREGADRLAGIFRAMREARRLEESVDRADLEAVDLASLARACCEAYGSLDAAHRWSVSLTHDVALATGAPELLVQAMDKLTDNARSFTPAGGLIELVVRRQGRGWWFGVRDEGTGLPDTMGAHLFDSLVSVRQPDGGFHLGLGLHIVRLIARGHGGKATARNRRDNRGAELGMWLPERPPVEAASPLRLVSGGPPAYTP